MIRTLRPALAATLAAAVVVSLAACSNDSDSDTPTASGAGFPVTITHAYGTTTIPAAPTRVVAVSDADIVVALGVTPVGIVKNSGNPSGIVPHLQGKIDQTKTNLLDVPPGGNDEGSAGVNIEQVAALKPDLILAINDYTLKADYPLLSRIAPTIGYTEKYNGDTWQEQTRIAAKALGRTGTGEKVITDTETTIRAAKEKNPGLAGKTVSFSFAFAPGQIVTLKSEQDYAVKLLQDLGLTIPAAVRGLPDIAPGNPGGALSYENISLLDADIVIMLYANDDVRKQVEAVEAFKNLSGVKTDRYAVWDLATISALRLPTVSSIPWALEKVQPDLARVSR